MTIDVNRVAAAAIDAAFEEDHHRHRGLSSVTALAAGVALATVARAATQKKLPRIAKFGVVEKLADASNLRDLSAALRDRLADHGLLNDEKDDRYGPDDAWDERDDYEDQDEGGDEPGDIRGGPPEDEGEADWDEEQEDSDDDEPDDANDEEDDAPWDEEDDEPRDEDEEDDEPSDGGDAEPDAGTEEEWDDEPDEDEQGSEAPGIEIGSANGGAAQRAERGFSAASQRGRTRGAAPDLMQLLDTPHSPPPVLRRARKEDALKRPPQPAPRTRQDDGGSKRTPRARSSNSNRNSKAKEPAGRKQKAGRN